MNPTNQTTDAVARPSHLRGTILAATKHRLMQPFLIILTFTTTFLTGATLSFLQHAPAQPSRLQDLFASLISEIVYGNNTVIFEGVTFSLALMSIMAAHEFGHYFACKYYKVEATSPYFLPAPPGPFTPFGTFGAVIKIKSPIKTKRALFDIGIAGPLAGFCLALPLALIGLITAKEAPPPLPGAYQYNDPLLFILISKAFHLPPLIEWNPLYWASWAGLLITALNLFPFGQLDGGHVTYSVIGRRGHTLVSKATLALSALLLLTDIYLHRQASWIVWVALLYVLLKLDHPAIEDNEPIGRARIALALLALAVFLLSFIPFPMTAA